MRLCMINQEACYNLGVTQDSLSASLLVLEFQTGSCVFHQYQSKGNSYQIVSIISISSIEHHLFLVIGNFKILQVLHAFWQGIT